MSGTSGHASVGHLQDFNVIELRRYTIRDGLRERFARYFESFFPDAFQQLGAIALGEGLERDNADRFTWLRGFRDMPGRAIVNAAFYYGPLWKEHRDTLNGLMLDSDNVLLMKPLTAAHRVPVLPAVDPVEENVGAQGAILMQVFAVTPGEIERFAALAEPAFARYREAGVRDAGLLVTLDEPNNFPQLPVRGDGPFLVWLGVADAVTPAYDAARAHVFAKLMASDLLREPPEHVVLDPAPRSRLRYLQGNTQ